ncbi:MAG TPA: hypothetical protein VIL01_07230 [Thermomicrobiales bacterium]
MRRGCMIAVGAVLLVCLVTLGLAYFVLLPRARDAVKDSTTELLATEVAIQVAVPEAATPTAATYVISEDELNASLRARSDDIGLADEVTITITPANIELRLITNEQESTYTGQVAAVDGRFVVTEMTADGMYEVLLSASAASEAIEDAVNGVLDARQLRLVAVTLAEGSMTLDVEPAS